VTQTQLFGSDKLLSQARKEVMDSLDDGTTCPCCDKYVRRYKRKFNSTMARSLLWLVEANRLIADGWVNVPYVAPRWLVQTNQLPTVRWWGLIERHPNTDSTTKHSGLWRPTDAGIAFAAKESKIIASAITYNGNVTGFTGGEIDIEDALGEKFDYSKMMGAR
jgi:hypothetical protein